MSNQCYNKQTTVQTHNVNIYTLNRQSVLYRSVGIQFESDTTDYKIVLVLKKPISYLHTNYCIDEE